MQDTPTICNASYATSTIDPAQLAWAGQAGNEIVWDRVNQLMRGCTGHIEQSFHQNKQQTHTDNMATTNRRIVQVFIADPNENVPLDKSVLYTGTQKLTDLTDTELFFEVPMAETLKTHNSMRVACIDKEATKRAGKDIFLDPVRIRDLKMVVVTVATF